MKRTTAINKLLSLKKRKRVIQGGTWAGKTYGIIAVIIDWCAKNQNKKFTVVAETIPALKEGALTQFIEIMMKTNRWLSSRFNKVELSYHFANGSKIQFKSFDSFGKAKAAGKRDGLFINEANHINYEIADALIMRTEGFVWIDYNPDNEFWAHTEILTQEDAEFCLLKYTDNESCPETIVNELLSKQEKAKTSEYWANWCRVYIDGEIGSLQGVVYQNWQQIKEIPKEAKLIGYGMDFGFTADPTTLIEVYKLDKCIYLNELIYKQGLINSDIIATMNRLNINKHLPIIADSAEPKTIEEIRRSGYRIEGAEKGQDSVRAGISTLQGFDLFVTENSLNTIKEFRSYIWEVDKTGKTTNYPCDNNNHAMDAIRYFALNKLKSNSGKYTIL